MTENTNTKILDREVLTFFAVLFITFLTVYFSPSLFLTRVLFLAIIPIIYKTKRDYFWIAWFFVISDAPGFFFKGGVATDPDRLPVYPLASGISLSLTDIVLVVFLVKSLSVNYKFKRFLFYGEVKAFVALVVFYLVVTLFFDFDFILVGRILLPWLFVYVVFKFIPDLEGFDRFNKLILPIIFLVFAANVYTVLTGVHPVNIFKSEAFLVKSHLSKQIISYSMDMSRPLYSVVLVIYSVTASFFYLQRKSYQDKKLYFYIIIATALTAVFLTGTRGYLLSVGFLVFFSFLTLKPQETAKVLVSVFILIVILVFAILSNPILSYQFLHAADRFVTIFSLLQGDLTAEGTLWRITVRIPQILSRINDSPILGYGFSDFYFKYADNDIGFFSNILNVGYLGMIFLYGIVVSVFIKLINLGRSKRYVQIFNRSSSIFIFGLSAIFLYHFSTNSMYGLVPGATSYMIQKYFNYVLLLNLVNVTYMHVYGGLSNRKRRFSLK